MLYGNVQNLRKFVIKVVFQELYPRHVGDIREAMLLLLEKGKSVRIEFFWVVAWNIWWDRNKKIHGDSSGTLHDVLRLARQMMEDFLNLNHEQQASPQSPAWWHAPDNGILKANTDGATFENDGGLGIGVVIRDHNGNFIAGRSCRTQGNFSAEVIEALAIQEGCHLAQELDLHNIIIESDAQVIVQAIQEGHCEGPCIGHILFHIRELLTMFPNA